MGENFDIQNNPSINVIIPPLITFILRFRVLRFRVLCFRVLRLEFYVFRVLRFRVLCFIVLRFCFFIFYFYDYIYSF